MSLREDLRAALLAGTRKVVAWTDRHGAATALFPEADAFFNVNTPADLERRARDGGRVTSPVAGPPVAGPPVAGPPVVGPPVAGIVGWKNSGKTGLMERVIAELAGRGLRVATIKHAHHDAEVDRPGTDSFRHRAAGAGQVILATPRRWALMTELSGPEPALAGLVARLGPCDVVLVEGFKGEGHPRIEAHRLATGRAPMAPGDPGIRAVASDGAPAVPCPLLPLNDARAVADLLLAIARPL